MPQTTDGLEQNANNFLLASSRRSLSSKTHKAFTSGSGNHLSSCGFGKPRRDRQGRGALSSRVSGSISNPRAARQRRNVGGLPRFRCSAEATRRHQAASPRPGDESCLSGPFSPRSPGCRPAQPSRHRGRVRHRRGIRSDRTIDSVHRDGTGRGTLSPGCAAPARKGLACASARVDGERTRRPCLQPCCRHHSPGHQTGKCHAQRWPRRQGCRLRHCARRVGLIGYGHHGGNGDRNSAIPVTRTRSRRSGRCTQ